MEFSQIPIEKLPDVWLALLPFIEKAMEYSDDEQGIEDVYHEIQRGDAQLWAVHKDTDTQAVAVTKLVETPRKKICRVVYFSGKGLDEMMYLWPQFEAWAFKENKCTDIEWLGRPGFLKVMKPQGYSLRYIVMRKNITLSNTLH